ncbi:CYTH domain-containing protein [Paucibacter sp. APW11]|uniref:CYTH domain-containing protein n=1 Tax=Roseateles aquae TaxID=3077235 RepID=A0ABU3P8P1_9BURK|nr:CYTH domain-containing protein [Paucibacter sp. APW11]MDT8998944.1 CYTH domain-containing protein [Paucibacter sp. APW11]
MGIEIERKFLVQGEAWRAAEAQSERLCQAYLSRDPARTVRVRIAGDQAWLTIKGQALGKFQGESSGISRAEFEYPIPLADAQQLLALADGPAIDKIRHRIRHAGMTWEVDEFLGDNAGLVVAEIELASEGQSFEAPPWLGAEVSSDARYFNSALSRLPYRHWTR